MTARWSVTQAFLAGWAVGDIIGKVIVIAIKASL